LAWIAFDDALVETVVAVPEQIVPGDLGIQVAQSRWQDGLLRIPFVDVAGGS